MPLVQEFIFFVIKAIAVILALIWTALRWLLGNRIRSKVCLFCQHAKFQFTLLR